LDDQSRDDEEGRAMRHGVDGRKLGRNSTQRKALYRSLVIALIAHERIHTTTPKAKEARRLAERLITFAKRGDLAARRHVARILHDKLAVQKLFAELGPRYASRPGGYTRVLKLGRWRKGDNAELALLELVTDHDHSVAKPAADAPAKAGRSKGGAAGPKQAAGKKAAAKPAKQAAAKPQREGRKAAPKPEKTSRAKGPGKAALSGAGKKRGASKGKGSGD
jgi:large subunit ribosomal protein L17